MSDLFDKCDAFWKRMRRTTRSDEEFLKLRSLFFREFPVANCLPYIQMDGREMLQVATNDYLGLAMHWRRLKWPARWCGSSAPARRWALGP